MSRLNVDEQLNQLYPAMQSWRRHMHQYPELSFAESETSHYIAAELAKFGCEVRTNESNYGIIVSIKGEKPGPVIALRADIDALPIQDEKNCEYASKVPNVMHACGHDGHTAALLAVAAYYSQNREELAGERRLLFQPAEEVTPGGALGMIEAGALEHVDAIYGVHLWTPLPYGTFASKEGPLMAAADDFDLSIIGRGGHGGLPHEAVDAIMVGVSVVQSLQTLVSRNVNPLHPAVLTVGSFQAGAAHNVIAEVCELKGTIRTFDEQARVLMHERLKAVIAHTCALYGADYKLHLRLGYPPVVNDEQEAERFFQVGVNLFGAEAVKRAEPITVAEDFAYYLQQIPGCFMFVGAGNDKLDASYPHHHPKFDFDERAMAAAARLLIEMAEMKAADMTKDQLT